MFTGAQKVQHQPPQLQLNSAYRGDDDDDGAEFRGVAAARRRRRRGGGGGAGSAGGVGGTGHDIGRRKAARAPQTTT